MPSAATILRTLLSSSLLPSPHFSTTLSSSADTLPVSSHTLPQPCPAHPLWTQPMPSQHYCPPPAYGIGAVMSHKMLDGPEKPVEFVSCTLAAAEKKYSQMEKEGLTCMCGVKTFHSYLVGHHSVLQTDHNPLLTLFNEAKAVPQ